MVFPLRYTLFICCFLWLLTAAQAQTCKGSLGDPVVNITFGTGTNTTQLSTIAPGANTNYTYVTHNCPNDGYYTITNTVSAAAGYTCFGNDWFQPTEDHTPNDVNGSFAVYNTRNITSGSMYMQTVGGLCANTTYEFASWVANLVKVGVCGAGAVHPNITFQIEDLNGNTLGAYTTGTIQPSPTFTWKQYGLVFKTPANTNQVVLKIIAITPGGCGNDLIIDDITFRPCGPTVAVASSVPVIYAGQTAILTATVSAGYDNPVYQWQQSNDGGLTWTDIPDANSLVYDITNAVAGTTYRLLVAENGNITIPSGRTASNPVSLIIYPVPELTTPPVISEVYVGTLVDLADFISNSTTIYNWKIDNTSLGLSQASGIGQVPIFTATGVGTITFTVTATLNGHTSEPKTFLLKISPALTVSLRSDQSVISKGNKATLTASAEGGTPNYTFNWSNNLVGGAVQTISPDTSTTYTVTVTDSKGYSATNSMKILVNTPPTITNCNINNVKCNGQTNGSITISANGAGILQYSLDGVVFQNSTVFNNLSAGNYTVTVKDGKDRKSVV